MSVKEENELLKMIIETQLSRINEQEETIRELRTVIEELRSIEANLKETLVEFNRRMYGTQSEKISVQKQEKPDQKENRSGKRPHS